MIRKAIKMMLMCMAFCNYAASAQAQRFFNLTQDQVKIDSILPHFSHTIDLYGNYADSTYTATILYPEFIDMTAEDIANYRRIGTIPLPSLPTPTVTVASERKRSALLVQFSPLVQRNGRYQILVSFMLRIDAKAKTKAARRLMAMNKTADRAARYATHSALRSGKWAKIRVKESGIHQLTDAVIKRAGFSNLNNVHIYGYGGRMLNEVLTDEDLQHDDDLKEIPTCNIGGKRLFYAQGTVSWDTNTQEVRSRNPYSDYGYYFITENETPPTTIDSTEFIHSFYPSPDFYHTLIETDNYAYFQGGRNLFDKDMATTTRPRTVHLPANPPSKEGTLTVRAAASQTSVVRILHANKALGEMRITLHNANYDKGGWNTASYPLTDIAPDAEIKIEVVSGGPVSLDFVSVAWSKPFPRPSLTASYPAPQYYANITRQDRHADPQADMIIIIPTTQKLLAQAQKLAQYHARHDSMRVNIVPADELYNEFSSGTPDASAYRRYIKMLYDRAQSDADLPKHLLLMGDCVWDNRMLTDECAKLNPDDYLLSVQSENSFSETDTYTDDGFFALLDDGEGSNPLRTDKLDIGVGRFPVTNEEDAAAMVSKSISYMENKNAGPWQNTIMFMGDDGDNNVHMTDLNDVAEYIMNKYPDYRYKKVMWDAYAGENTSAGHSYPDVAAAIKTQQQEGALIMDYAGHGSNYQISHERVLTTNDFKAFTNKNLPLWITASCDIMPYDGTKETLGEQAVINKNGGAVALLGTVHTVWTSYNKALNRAYLRNLLTIVDGRPITIGEAQRRAKNFMIETGQDLTCNKLQYALLGDPALRLHLPTKKIVVDAINGKPINNLQPDTLKAGQHVRIEAHVEGDNTFNGLMGAVVSDTRTRIQCNMNPSAGAETPFEFYDRKNVLYNGNDSVRNGKIAFSFVVPIDINYASERGLINLYAVDKNRNNIAAGSNTGFIVGGSDIQMRDSLGPKIYCYLNTPEFKNGDAVNTTPYFVANISDEDGINTSGSGLGHDMTLIIDNKPELTYNLNSNFQYDFGSFTSGSTYQSIPALEPGKHSLTFRAWDVFNHYSETKLDFYVEKSRRPTIYTAAVTQNPAQETTTFVVGHSYQGNDVDITIEVFNSANYLLWRHNEKGVNTTAAYTYTWDLTTSEGQPLPTGVYLYRIRLKCADSRVATQANKLIIIRNN